MRFFLNVIYEFEKSQSAFGTTLSDARKILRENSWSQERILFHFKDINDAAEEKSTVHSKLIRKFPQMEPYWNSDYEHYKARNGAVFICGNPPRNVAVKPHQHSHFTNFPGWKDGRIVYMPDDDAITGELMEAICEKIPRPYSFYQAVVVLDGVDWFGDCDLFPAIEWSVAEEEQEAGNWSVEPMIDEAFPEYQSNSIRLAKMFDMGLELDLQIELTEARGMDEASKIIAIFTEQFGMPTKQYVRARGSWEERGAWQRRKKEMQQFFDRWQKETRETLSLLYEKEKEAFKASKKSVSRKTMQKHFLEENCLCRHKLRRWDDYGWYKVLPHHYYYHIELMVKQKPLEGRSSSQNNRCVNLPDSATQQYPHRNGYLPTNGMSMHCYGCNFDLICNVVVEDFGSEEGDPAGEIAFLIFDEFLRRFEEQAVPELAKIYGDTPETFVQPSFARDYIHNQRCITGIIDVPG